MGLLDLPTELRIHIFSYLPDFHPGRTETVGPNVRITPAICRISRRLREEALPLYAKTASFSIQTDDDVHSPNSRMSIWLDALSPEALALVHSLQLSRHWQIQQPSRWQGHVGFYVRLQRLRTAWLLIAGTYPIANDVRGMRAESVELLRSVVERRGVGEKGLVRGDVEFVVAAMEIVAEHPVPAFDVEQSEEEGRRRKGVWRIMERGLAELGSGDVEDVSTRPFFTPY